MLEQQRKHSNELSCLEDFGAVETSFGAIVGLCCLSRWSLEGFEGVVAGRRLRLFEKELLGSIEGQLDRQVALKKEQAHGG